MAGQAKGGRPQNVTWNNRLSLVRQVLLFGVSEGDLQSDPTAGLRLLKTRSQSPLPYDDADAVKILQAAREKARPSRRWAHWIMAFTGMRAGEVLQLTGGDVRQQDGIWFLAVNEDAEGKSVKTGQRRNVPIHPALVAEGMHPFDRLKESGYVLMRKAPTPLRPDNHYAPSVPNAGRTEGEP